MSGATEKTKNLPRGRLLPGSDHWSEWEVVHDFQEEVYVSCTPNPEVESRAPPTLTQASSAIEALGDRRGTGTLRVTLPFPQGKDDFGI